MVAAERVVVSFLKICPCTDKWCVQSLVSCLYILNKSYIWHLPSFVSPITVLYCLSISKHSINKWPWHTSGVLMERPYLQSVIGGKEIEIPQDWTSILVICCEEVGVMFWELPKELKNNASLICKLSPFSTYCCGTWLCGSVDHAWGCSGTLPLQRSCLQWIMDRWTQHLVASVGSSGWHKS